LNVRLLSCWAESYRHTKSSWRCLLQMITAT
jgi:hypothetical protein